MIATAAPRPTANWLASPCATAATRDASSAHVVSRYTPSSLARNATRPGRVRARSTSRPGIVEARRASKFIVVDDSMGRARRIVRGLMATVTEDVKAIGLNAGARVVGAGGDGPTAGAWRSPDHRVMEITGYDLRENVAIHAMCDYIEGDLGHYAVQAPSLPVHGHEPPMSMMHAAELAGLGSRSFAAHIILNPEYGLLYYAALITTLPLPADPPLAAPACPHPGCVAMYKRTRTPPCLRVCPACLSGTLKDARIETSTYDREKCHSRAQTYGIGSFQKALLAVVNEDDAGRRREMIHSDFFEIGRAHV